MVLKHFKNIYKQWTPTHEGQPRATHEKRLVITECDEGSAKLRSHSRLALGLHASHSLL